MNVWDKQMPDTDNRSTQRPAERDMTNWTGYVVSALVIRLPGAPTKVIFNVPIWSLASLSPSPPSTLSSSSAFTGLGWAAPPPGPGVMLWNQVRLVKTAVGLWTAAREGGEKAWEAREEGGCSTDGAYGWCVDAELWWWWFTTHTAPNGWLMRPRGHRYDNSKWVWGFLLFRDLTQEIPSEKTPIDPVHTGKSRVIASS